MALRWDVSPLSRLGRGRVSYPALFFLCYNASMTNWRNWFKRKKKDESLAVLGDAAKMAALSQSEEAQQAVAKRKQERAERIEREYRCVLEEIQQAASVGKRGAQVRIDNYPDEVAARLRHEGFAIYQRTTVRYDVSW